MHDFKQDLCPSPSVTPLDLLFDESRHGLSVLAYVCKCGRCAHGSVAIVIRGVMTDEIRPLGRELHRIIQANLSKPIKPYDGAGLGGEEKQP